MKKLGLKNKEVASRMNISEQNYSNMLNGHRAFTDNMLVKLSEVIGVPFDTLKYGKDLDAYVSNSASYNVRGHGNSVGHGNTSNNQIGTGHTNAKKDESGEERTQLDTEKIRLEIENKMLREENERLLKLIMELGSNKNQ